jgi:hypothetical protein
VVESLANVNEQGSSQEEMASLIRRLGQRWFVVRNVHADQTLMLLRPRWAMSFLRGPMKLGDIRRVSR